jgi:hypothetical protein
MAVTHENTVLFVRNGLADYVVDIIDTGTGDAQGDLVIMTSGDVEVATLAFSNPAFGAASSGTATANSITADSSATGGTAALFKVQDRDNQEIFRGSVTAVGGGGDIELSSTSIGAGDTVSISSLTYTAPN